MTLQHLKTEAREKMQHYVNNLPESEDGYDLLQDTNSLIEKAYGAAGEEMNRKLESEIVPYFEEDEDLQDLLVEIHAVFEKARNPN